MVALALASCATQEQPKEAPRGLKDAVGDKFTIGVAVNGEQMAGRDSASVAIVLQHFNSLVGENVMKHENIHPADGQYDFAGADSLVAFAQAHNMELIGHCLVWHSQTAPWYFVDSAGVEVSKEVLLNRIREHIRTVAGRYKGKIKGWDVCNEVIEDDGSLRQSPFGRICGYDFIYEAFKVAHEVDPDAELYLNDYGMTNPGRRSGYLALIDSLRQRGLRVDAMGLQGHMGIDYPDSAAVEQTIADFEEIGMPVMITEWDMGALPTFTQSADVSQGIPMATPENDIYRDGLPDDVNLLWNKRMRMMWDIFVRHSANVKRVTVWGVSDVDSWKNDFPVFGRKDYPLLFDRDYQPKPFVKDIIFES